MRKKLKGTLMKPNQFSDAVLAVMSPYLDKLEALLGAELTDLKGITARQQD